LSTKLIGILGGTSWPSTGLFYRMVNQEVHRRLGGNHSTRIVLYSIGYHQIKSRYLDRWAEIPGLLRPEIDRLLSFGPDCWMLANNTLHKAYDEIAQHIAPIPFFHAVTLTRDHLIRKRVRSALLLGTKFTMEDDFFAGPLNAAGIRVVVPAAQERDEIQAVQSQLAQGEMTSSFRDYFDKLLARYEGQDCDAVVTACTELPLVVDQGLTSMAVVDPLELQCGACVDFALS
jgi:aspartate racemase